MTDHNISSRPGRSTRPVVRDLRFACTVAAGLCAGVLGVGAIAAPFVGWNDWPDALKSQDGKSLVVTRPSNPGSAGSGGHTRPPARVGVVGPVAAPGAILVTTPGGVLAPAGTGTADTNASGGTRSDSARSLDGDTGDARPGGSVNRNTGFIEPADTDGDGMADTYEQANGLDPNSNDAAADADNDGIPNETEYQLRTAANNNDTNNDGVEDGIDDYDGDLVPNALEVALGTSPLDRADGTLDSDGDGITNADEVQNGTDPAVDNTTPPPDAPPVVEPTPTPAPVDPETPAPVEQPATSDPTTPTDPATPTDPSTPSDPATPADPADPATPAEPATPTDPATPADPATPTDPATPSDGTPADPETPVEPADQPGDDSGDSDKGPDHQAPVADAHDKHATKPDPVALDDHSMDPVPTDPPDTPSDQPAASAAPPAAAPAAPPVQAAPPTPAPAPVAAAPAPPAQVAPPTPGPEQTAPVQQP